MKWIAHIDMDAFFAKCEELRNPELGEKPLVICIYTRGGDSGAVSTSNYKARELGIKSGMSLSKAKKLATDETVFVPADHEFYSEKSEEVMSVLRSYADKIQKTSVDEAYFKLRNYPEKKAKKIKADIETLGLSASVGISDNKFVAKMASEHDKPDGLTVVDPGSKKEFLADKPVEQVQGVGDKTAAKLKERDVSKVKHIRQKESSDLAALLGKNKAASLQRKARGEGSARLEETETKQMSKILTISSNSSDYRYIRKFLAEAVSQLHLRLKKRSKGYGKAGIIVKTADLETYTRSKKIKNSVGEDKLLREADLLLKQLLQNQELTVRRIGVRASDLMDRDRQTSLSNFQDARNL